MVFDHVIGLPNEANSVSDCPSFINCLTVPEKSYGLPRMADSFVGIEYRESSVGSQVVLSTGDDLPAHVMNRYAACFTRKGQQGPTVRYVLTHGVVPGQEIRTFPLDDMHPAVPAFRQVVHRMSQLVASDPGRLPEHKPDSLLSRGIRSLKGLPTRVVPDDAHALSQKQSATCWRSFQLEIAWLECAVGAGAAAAT